MEMRAGVRLGSVRTCVQQHACTIPAHARTPAQCAREGDAVGGRRVAEYVGSGMLARTCTYRHKIEAWLSAQFVQMHVHVCVCVRPRLVGEGGGGVWVDMRSVRSLRCGAFLQFSAAAAHAL